MSPTGRCRCSWSACWCRAATRRRFPGGYEDDLISLAFAFENLMLAARAEGLGSVPITAFQRFEKDRLREILGMPAEIDPAIVTPLGYPEAFPTGLAPALKRNFRPWKALVHDDRWGAAREQGDARRPEARPRPRRGRRPPVGRAAALVARRRRASGAPTAPRGWKGTLMVVTTIGHLAEAAWHHPDLRVGYARGGGDASPATTPAAITERDLALARRSRRWSPGGRATRTGPLSGTPDDPRFAYLAHDD